MYISIEDLFNLEKENLELDHSFAFRLFYKTEFPRWLRPLPYPDAPLPRLLRTEVMLLEVVDGQEMSDAEK